MSNTLYYNVESTDQAVIDKAGSFLMNNLLNLELKKHHSNIHIYHTLDLVVSKKNDPDNEGVLKILQDKQGQGDISTSRWCTEDEESAGYEDASEIKKKQIQVLLELNEIVEMRYHAYSSAFKIGDKDAFTLEQIRSITNNGKLLSGIKEHRVLYSQVIEPVNDPFVVIDYKKSSKESRKLLKTIKEQNEDFEWYPTTREIIEAVYWDIKERDKWYEADSIYHPGSVSILDVGAGDGKLFRTLKEISIANPDCDDRDNRNYTELNISDAFAIEKSKTLINAMDKDIFIIGTDFWEQTLIDKEVDIVFSNPPYAGESQDSSRNFARWSEKLILEANAEDIYLVVPQRWENDLGMAKAIELRQGVVTIIGEYDFLESEDRKARAKVHLIKVSLSKSHSRSGTRSKNTDPFEIWFNDTFKIKADKTADSSSDWHKQQYDSKRIKNLVKGSFLIPRLEELYNEELEYLMQQYTKVTTLDADLLKELNISIEGLLKALKMRIKGLKNKYWRELFDNLDTITSKLTKSSREKLLGTLTSRTNIDFTTSNAYSVVIWAIKNANKYYDSQLLELYFSFANSKNIHNYKSNKRLVEDGWRYLNDKMSHFSLDYRIVLGGYYNETFDFEYGSTIVRGIKENTVYGLMDLFTVARNLGFNVATTYSEENKKLDSLSFQEIRNLNWQPGKNQNFNILKPSSNAKEEMIEEKFVEVKAFKNGNLHYRFTPKFMKALNIEAARINKWIKTPKEACEEFDISNDEAVELFGSNFMIEPTRMTNLLPISVSEPEINSQESQKSDLEKIKDSESSSTLEAEVVNNEEYEAEHQKCYSSGTLF